MVHNAQRELELDKQKFRMVPASDLPNGALDYENYFFYQQRMISEIRFCFGERRFQKR